MPRKETCQMATSSPMETYHLLEAFHLGRSAEASLGEFCHWHSPGSQSEILAATQTRAASTQPQPYLFGHCHQTG